MGDTAEEVATEETADTAEEVANEETADSTAEEVVNEETADADERSNPGEQAYINAFAEPADASEEGSAVCEDSTGPRRGAKIRTCPAKTPTALAMIGRTMTRQNDTLKSIGFGG